MLCLHLRLLSFKFFYIVYVFYVYVFYVRCYEGFGKENRKDHFL